MGEMMNGWSIEVVNWTEGRTDRYRLTAFYKDCKVGHSVPLCECPTGHNTEEEARKCEVANAKANYYINDKPVPVASNVCEEPLIEAKTDPVIDELEYEFDLLLEKYVDRLPVASVLGLLGMKAIELCLEHQGVDFNGLREALSILNIT